MGLMSREFMQKTPGKHAGDFKKSNGERIAF